MAPRAGRSTPPPATIGASAVPPPHTRSNLMPFSVVRRCQIIWQFTRFVITGSAAAIDHFPAVPRTHTGDPVHPHFPAGPHVAHPLRHQAKVTLPLPLPRQRSARPRRCAVFRHAHCNSREIRCCNDYWNPSHAKWHPPQTDQRLHQQRRALVRYHTRTRVGFNAS